MHGRCAMLALAAAAAFGGSPFRLPEGPGKQLVESACSSCHSLDILAGKQFSRQKWRVIVLGMTDSASLDPQQRAQVLEYLTRHFGSNDRGKELVEDICSICHEWERVKDHPQSREEWAGTIKGMIFEGAPVTGEEFDEIVNFLAKNYGRAEDSAKGSGAP